MALTRIVQKEGQECQLLMFPLVGSQVLTRNKHLYSVLEFSHCPSKPEKIKGMLKRFRHVISVLAIISQESNSGSANCEIDALDHSTSSNGCNL